MLLSLWLVGELAEVVRGCSGGNTSKRDRVESRQ